MSLEGMMTDSFTLHKRSGAVVTFKGLLSPNQLTTFDAMLPVEEGDTIERTLPNGVVEHYLVIDTGFRERFSSIAPHFQMKVRKETSLNAY
jgi:hypothetical protein